MQDKSLKAITIGMANSKERLEEERLSLEVERLKGDLLKQAAEQRKLELELERSEREFRNFSASSDQSRIYTFVGEVDDKSASEAMKTLEAWGRRDPGEPITVVFNSPGGTVTDGLALFDTMLDLRRQGHHVTTIARGQVASMGGILLQAGSERVIGPGAHMLIHQIRWGNVGSTGEHEDYLEFTRMLEKRALKILSERSKMTGKEIEEAWHRKDWWLPARQVVKLGFADRIG